MAGKPRPDDVERVETSSGIEAPLVADADTLDADLHERLGVPGSFPFTRGIYPTMYRGRLWTMRQYAGFGSAKETNERFRYLLDHGTTGLSCAFDLPTQIGYDSDAPIARGEVGKVGVAIDTLDDMAMLFDRIPLDEVTTSMTINAPASVLLALYLAVGEKQGVPKAKLGGTVQNDILKEYIARGTYIYPPKHSMRLTADVIAYCSEHVPRWNTISISGYHIREAGATAVQELAFTLANARAYVQAVVDRGLDVDAFAPRLSFFFNAHSDLLEEVAKFRAARRLWAHLMRDEFGAKEDKSMMLRFHTQTAGSTLTAQQPLNNVVRTTVEAVAAVLGGTQSLHTNGYDEALGLPTEQAARVALRTQQLLAHESGIANTIDPLAGSYYVEHLTDELEAGARDYLKRIDAMGGMLDAIEKGWVQNEVQESAWQHQKAVESGERRIVGVNAHRLDDEEPMEVLSVDEAIEEQQVRRLAEVRAARDQGKADAALARLTEAAENPDDNLMPHILRAIQDKATLGEVCNALRSVWGEYRDPSGF